MDIKSFAKHYTFCWLLSVSLGLFWCLVGAPLMIVSSDCILIILLISLHKCSQSVVSLSAFSYHSPPVKWPRDPRVHFCISGCNFSINWIFYKVFVKHNLAFSVSLVISQLLNRTQSISVSKSSQDLYAPFTSLSLSLGSKLCGRITWLEFHLLKFQIK